MRVWIPVLVLPQASWINWLPHTLLADLEELVRVPANNATG